MVRQTGRKLGETTFPTDLKKKKTVKAPYSNIIFIQ